MKKIGIVFAMEQEFLPVFDVLGTLEKKEGTQGFPVSVYKNADKTVYAIVSGVGQIRASAATQLLISKYSAECVLNFGLAGGLAEGIRALDTVLVDSVVQADFDLSAGFNYVKGQHSGFSSPFIKTDRKLLEKAMRLADFPVVVCASADRFVDSRRDREAVNKEFGAHICEMEAAGVQLASMLNGVPALFVKTVSDGIDGGATEFFAVADKAVNEYKWFLKELLKVL